MTLRAQINTDTFGNITVHINGGLDFESTVPFRDELEGLAYKNPQSTITIDMHNLDFVGSSGIGHFVETLKLLRARRKNIHLSNVKIEFMKVFKLYNFGPLEEVIKKFDQEVNQEVNQEIEHKALEETTTFRPQKKPSYDV